jgi:glycosyltransferase involved in cell wall biosynthesis
MSAVRPRILLIGPLPRASSPIGGTQVSFGALVNGFRESGAFDVEVVDTTREHAYERSLRGAAANFESLLRVLAKIAVHGRRFELVFFNASSGGVLYGGPLVAALTRCMRRPLIVRAFGGALDEDLAAAPALVRGIAERTTLRATALLLQTEMLCRSFAGNPSVWKLPTTRRAPASARARTAPCRRLLFLSQLRPEKGIAEALEAIEYAPAGCTLSVYGPALPGSRLAALSASSRSRFHGELDPRDVSEVLAQHDALLFPSYWPGEGLPGVVIEALQHGLPVIAARWRSLPELVHHGVNGLLVEPRSVAALTEALTRLASDDALFARLSAGALACGREFSAQTWQLRLEAHLLQLCSRAGAAKNDASVADVHEPAAPLPRRTDPEVLR